MQSRHPTFMQSLVAGGIAGTSVDLLFFPIDTIKTRLQSAQGFIRAGGFRGVYRGLGSVVVGSAPGAAAFFSVYDSSKRLLGSTLPPPVNHLLSASLGEIVACLIRVPTEVIKTRTQTSSYGPKTSSFHSARTILRTSGIKGFYQGFGITIMREIPFTSIQFPLWEWLKHQLSSYKGEPGTPLPPTQAALCGSVAGGVAAALTTPLDVVKTRIMLDIKQKSSRVALGRSIMHQFHTIYTREGWRTLFSGVVPRTMWISAGGAVFLGVYEAAVGAFAD